MNPFIHALLGSNSLINDIENLELRLVSGQETTINTISWFNAFKTSLFPEVVCDKEYFFLYGTDHDSADGSIRWGKGNELNLTDFVEVAEIISGNQTETPFVITVPADICGDTETLHFYYHTTTSEPGNDSKQQTRLMTSAGGAELHLMTWTDRGRPLGIVADENHTGYFMPYELTKGSYIGTHIGRAGLPQPWKNSVATNPRSWTRNETVDVINGVKDGYFAQLSEGLYFKKFNQVFWLGQIHPESSGGLTTAERILIIAKADKIGGAVTQLKILNKGAFNIRHSIYITENYAHIYITNPTTELYHAIYNLDNLKIYL